MELVLYLFKNNVERSFINLVHLGNNVYKLTYQLKDSVTTVEQKFYEYPKAYKEFIHYLDLILPSQL